MSIEQDTKPQTRTAAIVAAMASQTAYSLSGDAEGACDNEEARAFYEGIRNDYAEAVSDIEGVPTFDDNDELMHEIADGAPSMWNQTRMLEVVGTRTYQDDVSEYIDGAPDLDILTIAGWALYAHAKCVLDALVKIAETAAEEWDAEHEDTEHEHEFSEDTGRDRAGRTIYACSFEGCAETVEGGTEWKDQSK